MGFGKFNWKLGTWHWNWQIVFGFESLVLVKYECKWSLILFPWYKIVIYLSLVIIWEVQLKTMYIAVKLANSFWIWISVFGKRWMYSHMLSYWCFTCAVEWYFPNLHLHLCVPRNSVWLVWLNSWLCLLTSCTDWTWNIVYLCTRIWSEKLLYFVVHAFLNMCVMFVGSLFGSLAWLCVEFLQD